MSLESGCRERLLQSEDGRRAVALLDAWEKVISDHETEIARLRHDLEFESDCLEAARKGGKHLSEERSELRDEVTYLKQQLERYWGRHNKSRRYSYLWKEHAKALLVRIRELEGEATPVLAACDACFNECQGMARYSTAESDRYWELAEELMELTAKRLCTTISRAADADAAPKEGSE